MTFWKDPIYRMAAGITIVCAIPLAAIWFPLMWFTT